MTASPVGATRTDHRRAPDPVRIAGAGTGESRWRAWPGLAGLQPLTSTELPDQDPLLVAPHPDDEILGAGGLLAMLGAQVAAVTDGEASHPGSQVHRPDQLARLRRAETRAALSALGRSETTVHHLGHGDGAVDEVRLAEQLGDLLSPGRWCIATWRGDGHPDHEAAGRAAARACAATGARLIEYPIWMWHWARPGDPRVPWHQARRLVLSPSVRAAKRAAVGCFATQIHPLGPEPADASVLPPPVLARFDRDFETYFVPDPFPRVQDLSQRVPGPGL